MEILEKDSLETLIETDLKDLDDKISLTSLILTLPPAEILSYMQNHPDWQEINKPGWGKGKILIYTMGHLRGEFRSMREMWHKFVKLKNLLHAERTGESNV